MSLTNTDLLLVQRGNVPYRATTEDLSKKVRGDIDVSGPNKDIPVASASQLGVIRVGTNLSIDANGVLQAVIPAGLSYEGVWTNANTAPTATGSGEFWIWDGGDGITLNNALWGTANGDTVYTGDRIFYDGTTFEVLPGGGGGGGAVQTVTGSAPIVISGDAQNVDVGITAASSGNDGYMSSADFDKLDKIEPGAEVNEDPKGAFTTTADLGTFTLSPGGDTTTIPTATVGNAGLMSADDKATLDGLVATPGGVSSVTARNGITNNGTAGSPILDVDFGPLVNGDPANATVMPYDITMLAELP
jgi:hypothetical protein